MARAARTTARAARATWFDKSRRPHNNTEVRERIRFAKPHSARARSGARCARHCFLKPRPATASAAKCAVAIATGVAGLNINKVGLINHAVRTKADWH